MKHRVVGRSRLEATSHQLQRFTWLKGRKRAREEVVAAGVDTG